MPIDFSKLNSEQIKAARHKTGPAVVLAGPGSGKTRVLTSRIANLIDENIANPSEIMAITFTNKAAKEMKERVQVIAGDKAPSWIGTFHSTCSKILRIDGEIIDIPKTYNIYDTDDSVSLIKKIEDELHIDSKKTHPMDVLASISSAKQELIDEFEYDSYKQGSFQDKVARIYKIYQKRLKRSGALDFSDLISKTVELFNNNKIKEKYNSRFKFILVDEYQDTNRAQYILTKLLAGKSENIFVVGDMSQAIYSWRGADYRNINNFIKNFPKSTTYNLEQNYRSTQTIIEASKSLIKNNQNNINLGLWTDNSKGEKIVIYPAFSEKDEANYICKVILESGINYNSIAVLYRTNAQSRSIEDAFIKYNIPYKIYGGLKFYARREVKDIVSFLKVIANPKDEVSWARIINIPPKGIGKVTFDKIRKNEFDLEEISNKTKIDFKKLHEISSTTPTAKLIDLILGQTKYIQYLENTNEEKDKIEARIENIQELKTVANELENLTEFLESVSLFEDNEDKNEVGLSKVTLMTVHSAKGLEFDMVVIAGLEEGIFPHSRSINEREKLEEERRLCYVAITRAKTKLVITHATKREFFGRTSFNPVSRFVSEIPEHLVENKFSSNQNVDTKTIDDFFSELGI